MDSKVLKTSNRRRSWLLFGIIAFTIVFICVFNRRWAPSDSLGIVHFWLDTHPSSSQNSSARGVGQKDEPWTVAVAWDRYAIDTSNLTRGGAANLIDKLVLEGQLDFHLVARQPVDEEWLSPVEKEILQDGPVQSLDTVAVPKKSKLVLVSPVRNRTIKVGDKVTVRVDLKDAKGRQVQNGGHFVRVWMEQNHGGPRRSLAVDVTDLRNGSYVASLPVLWKGKIRVKAALVRTREVRRVLLLIKKLMKMTSQIVASFVHRKTEQVTLCSFLPVVPGFPKVCNLTADNSGLPWYCGKPNRSGLTCDDWAWSSNTGFARRYPVSETDNMLLRNCSKGGTNANRFQL